MGKSGFYSDNIFFATTFKRAEQNDTVLFDIFLSNSSKQK